ncbi:MAG TPA: peptidoglycan-binding domain-containing protein, partial [Rhizomicrobium sp.]
MKAPKLSAAILALVLSACAQDVETVVPSPAPPSVAPTPPQPPAHTATEVDAAAIGQAERDLKTLGYAAGKSDEINDATLRRAILAFEKDQGLAEDGQLSPAVQERLKQLRSAMLGRNSAPTKRNGLRVYSDGT